MYLKSLVAFFAFVLVATADFSPHAQAGDETKKSAEKKSAENKSAENNFWFGTATVKAIGADHLYVGARIQLDNPDASAANPQPTDEVQTWVHTPFPLQLQPQPLTAERAFLGDGEAELVGGMFKPSSLGPELKEIPLYFSLESENDMLQLTVFSDKKLREVVGFFWGFYSGRGAGKVIGMKCDMVWAPGNWEQTGTGPGKKLGSVAPLPWTGIVEVSVIGAGLVTVYAASSILEVPTPLVWEGSAPIKQPILWEGKSPAIVATWAGGGVLTMKGAMADVTKYAVEDQKTTWWFTLQGAAWGEGMGAYQLYSNKACTKCVGIWTGPMEGAGGGAIGIPDVYGYKCNWTWRKYF